MRERGRCGVGEYVRGRGVCERGGYMRERHTTRGEMVGKVGGREREDGTVGRRWMKGAWEMEGACGEREA